MTDADFLLAFAQVTHQLASERDLERADHAETRKLADNLERDLRRKTALLVESETIRRATTEELRQLRGEAARLGLLLREARQGVVPLRDGPRLHTGPPGRCQCGVVHGHGQAISWNAGRVERDAG